MSLKKKSKGKPKHVDHGRGLTAAVDIVIENTMAQHYREDLTKQEIAEYCESFFPPEFVDKALADALPNAVAARLRASKVVDTQGNEVRRFGNYKVAFTDQETLKETVYHCWKAWKHMSDGQMHQAVQANINQATTHNHAVKSLVRYLEHEVRPQKKLGRMKLQWKRFRDSAR